MINFKKGASLIEILIAIAISAIISTIAFIAIKDQIVKAKDAKLKNDLISIRNAFEQYYDDVGCYPRQLPNCEERFENGNIVYMNRFPCQKNNIPFVYELISEKPHDNRDGQKIEIECPSWYKLLINLENIDDTSIDLIGCRKGCGMKCKYNFGVSSSNMPINDGCPQYINYACTPSGYCAAYADPVISNCPIIFRDDPTCQNSCKIRNNRCQNERGKKIN